MYYINYYYNYIALKAHVHVLLYMHAHTTNTGHIHYKWTGSYPVGKGEEFFKNFKLKFNIIPNASNKSNLNAKNFPREDPIPPPFILP